MSPKVENTFHRVSSVNTLKRLALKMDRWGLQWKCNLKMEEWWSSHEHLFFPLNLQPSWLLLSTLQRKRQAGPTRYTPALPYAFEPRWSTSSEGHTPCHQRNDCGLQNERSPNGEARSASSQFFASIPCEICRGWERHSGSSRQPFQVNMVFGIHVNLQSLTSPVSSVAGKVAEAWHLDVLALVELWWVTSSSIIHFWTIFVLTLPYLPWKITEMDKNWG